ARAALRHRELGYRPARRPRHPQFDDRHRARPVAARGGRLMDGIHDLGGREGYGPIDVGEPPEPFHAPWEARLFGIVRGDDRPATFSIDRFRHVRECIDPAEYLARRYYDQWLLAHAVMMVAAGAATIEELATGKSARSLPGLPQPMPPEKVPAANRSL